MLSAFVIMFREMLEMSMVLGVLFVVTRPIPSARRWIYIGSAIGLAGASFVAAFMHEMENSLQGTGEMWFNAIVLALASVMIGWTVVWMSRHGRELSMRMQSVGQAVSVGELPQTALMMVALAAVLREGSEAVFFMWGAAMAVPNDGLAMTAGWRPAWPANRRTFWSTSACFPLWSIPCGTPPISCRPTAASVSS